MDTAGSSNKSLRDKVGALKKSLLENFNMVKLRQQNELHKENEFCDLILKSEDGFEIKVHKLVVSSASNYFKHLLTLPMKEKFEESILLPDITGDVLEKIITFIYTSEFDEEIEDVEKIVQYAVIFQLEQLVEICLLVLNESINDGTCVKYWRLAGNNLIYGLEEKCLEYIVSKADHLFESSLMSDLTIEEMRSLLADNRLHLQCDEKKIFEHVWKWAEGKGSEIKSFSQVFSEIIDLLDFSKLEKEFVCLKMFDNEDVLANAELLKKVAELTKEKFKDEVASRYTFHKPTQRRLFGLASNKMFIGLGEDTTIEKEFNRRDFFGYTTFNNKLLICGGKLDNCSFTNSCELFDPITQQWKNFQSMKIKRLGHQCAYLDNKIYACGGTNNKTVEIFDFGKGEWNYGPEMLANNYDFGLTGVNGALYAIGGETDNVEILDPRTQEWNIICIDPRIQTDVRCVSIGSCIYCFTGEKGFIFDTRSNKFTEEISCKHFAKYYWNYCEHNGYIYGLGYKDSGDKYSLNLIQYHLDGKQGFKKSYGLYDWSGITEPLIVSLYY